jgi:hypothetical protein
MPFQQLILWYGLSVSLSDKLEWGENRLGRRKSMTCRPHIVTHAFIFIMGGYVHDNFLYV